MKCLDYLPCVERAPGSRGRRPRSRLSSDFTVKSKPNCAATGNIIVVISVFRLAYLLLMPKVLALRSTSGGGPTEEHMVRRFYLGLALALLAFSPANAVIIDTFDNPVDG